MYTNLILSGGVTQGIAYIGVMKYLEEKQWTSSFKTYVGSSSGALFSFLFALGYTSDELPDIVTDLIRSYNTKEFDIDALFSFYKVMGIEDGSFVMEWLSRCLKKRLGVDDILFIDFCKKTGKNLVVCAANLSLGESEFFCVDNAPDVSVLSALRASISLPLMFTPVTIKDMLYVDAGLYNHFPLDFFPHLTLKDTLGVQIHMPITLATTKLNLLDYITCIVQTVISRANEKRNSSTQSIKIINMSFIEDSERACCLIPGFDFEQMKIPISLEKINAYIEKDYYFAYDAFRL